MNSNMVKINGSALMEYIRKNGIDDRALSIKLGYSKNYISGCAARSIIRNRVIEDLWNEANIPYTVYMLAENNEQDETEAPKEGELVTVKPHEFYDVIYTAVSAAIKDNQYELYKAVLGAMRKANETCNDNRR